MGDFFQPTTVSGTFPEDSKLWTGATARLGLVTGLAPGHPPGREENLGFCYFYRVGDRAVSGPHPS